MKPAVVALLTLLTGCSPGIYYCRAVLAHGEVERNVPLFVCRPDPLSDTIR